jgi:hypothetical protein
MRDGYGRDHSDATFVWLGWGGGGMQVAHDSRHNSIAARLRQQLVDARAFSAVVMGQYLTWAGRPNPYWNRSNDSAINNSGVWYQSRYTGQK